MIYQPSLLHISAVMVREMSKNEFHRDCQIGEGIESILPKEKTATDNQPGLEVGRYEKQGSREHGA
jgi:hypothetical protein